MLAAAIVAAVLLVPASASGTATGDIQIFGGSAATEAPWETFVYIEHAGGSAQCTGAVVGERWVLTAAHCLTEPEGPNKGKLLSEIFTLVTSDKTDVSLFYEFSATGDPAVAQRIFTELEPAQGQAYVISEEWNPETSAGDIALIRLDRPVAPELGIPAARADQASSFTAGRFGILSGWGVTESGSVSADLLDTIVPVRPAEDCAFLNQFGFTGSTMLCSGSNGPPSRGACNGDSGGALSAPGPWGAVIAGGVTSFGLQDCRIEPKAFTRVSAYSDFIAGTMTADTVAPVGQPRVDALSFTPAADGSVVGDTTVTVGGAATNLEFDFVPTLPAAPLRRAASLGSGSETRTGQFTLQGLAPGVTYDWNSHASSVLGRFAGPSGQVAVPGEVQALEPVSATTQCRQVLVPVPGKDSGDVDLTRGQLAINQRIGQAALKRLTAIEDWLNAGITAADICGGSIDGQTLDDIDLGRAGAGIDATAPSPRSLKIGALSPTDLSEFSVTAAQLRTNQRIYQAAVRRARALRARLNGGLTGGDIRDGELGWGHLPPGALMTSFGPGTPQPRSKTKVKPAAKKRSTSAPKVTPAQLKTNQRIAQAAVREANLLRAEIASGLTRGNFAAESITARDFTPEIAARLLADQS